MYVIIFMNVECDTISTAKQIGKRPLESKPVLLSKSNYHFQSHPVLKLWKFRDGMGLRMCNCIPPPPHFIAFTRGRI